MECITRGILLVVGVASTELPEGLHLDSRIALHSLIIKPKHLACFQACEIRSCGNSPLITFASEIAASLQQQQQQQHQQ